MKGRFLKEYLNKWKKVGTCVKPYTACEYSGQWASMHENSSIPSDVPKGHLVVYVGKNHKRFVIKIALLNHPLFKALLDQAQEEYGFSADSKLCIPCEEHLFLSVLCCASSPQHEQMCLCL
ncbi:auxin-induced protein X15-like [Prosopis cineraria]|uniref:auxin-induced protein X15-like n=1 Tax=Prosopis cineraria TaxID=364024 RepID=UPI00241009D5|nr:auxin-induced protein X15-like [Prosopis cineraria]